MKKFILCVAAGYALVFTLFIGLPQMMGGRGGTFAPSGSGASAVPGGTAGSYNTPAEQAQKPTVVTQNLQPVQPLQEQKDLKKYKTGPVETFYRNGTLSSEWVSDQEGRGFLKTYTPEGRPWMEIPFVNHVLEGELKTFYPEGPLFSMENYTAGELKGSTLWKYKNGNPWLEITCGPDEAQLLYALYSEDGKRADLPAVHAEQNTGYFKAFDEQGHEVINWQQAGGAQDLILKSYYQSGTLSAEVGLKDKSLSGRTARYYPDGTLWMETMLLAAPAAQKKTVYFEKQIPSFTAAPLTEPESGVEWKAYYPDGQLFWRLTKLVTKNHTAVFQLTTHWQDETSASAKKERVLL